MKTLMILSVLFVSYIIACAQAAEIPGTPVGLTPVNHSDTSAGTPATNRPVKHEGHLTTKAIGAESARSIEHISGTVLETMNNGGYSYIYLQKKNGDKIWVAVLETPVKVGSRMVFNSGIIMTSFESKGLKRTFDSIIFTEPHIAESETTATLNPDKKQIAASGYKSTTAAKDEKISVIKASGHNAITVVEAFANSTKLDKKKVVIRGKVVKVSTGIMKKNWIHIQDGTGTKANGSNNLVCTSEDLAEVGDVVTVSGTLAKDRDFGSGYRYNAIIEKAKFKK